jgi:hypothetical protein
MSAHHGPETLDLAALTAELASSFDVTPGSCAHLRGLLSVCGTACFRNQFSLAQVRAVLGVLQRVLEADMAAWQRGSAESLEYFQAELLALSVERPPHAEGLLNPVQATAALDFVLKTYYRAVAVACAIACAPERPLTPHPPLPFPFARARPPPPLPLPAEHFTLYKTVCARLPTLSLVTRNACEVDPPVQPPPLAEATQVH